MLEVEQKLKLVKRLLQEKVNQLKEQVSTSGQLCPLYLKFPSHSIAFTCLLLFPNTGQLCVQKLGFPLLHTMPKYEPCMYPQFPKALCSCRCVHKLHLYICHRCLTWPCGISGEIWGDFVCFFLAQEMLFSKNDFW